jgi:hypothetical protein
MRERLEAAPTRVRSVEPSVSPGIGIKPYIADILVHLLILVFGALQFGFYCRSDDFVYDATYAELARSLIENGSYGYNFRPETMLPPGCAAMAAVISICIGPNYRILIRSMAVFATLFLIAAYELLHREIGRGPAAAICLGLGSSPFLFDFSTHLLFSDLPFAFTSTMALLVATRLDASANWRSRALLFVVFGCLLVSSLMLRSAAIAILGALTAWLPISIFIRQSNLRLRLTTFVPMLAIGIAVQVLWTTWATQHQNLQWPALHGYPGSYASQLKLKQGNYPELGQASLSDIAVTVDTNIATRSAALLRLMSHLPSRWIEPASHSPLIVGYILLLLLGLGCSSWTNSSGLVQWYFACYEAMYLLWPWKLEERFLLPVIPLACMYVWRGGSTLVGLLRRDRRKFGTWIFVLSVIMTLYSATKSIRHPHVLFSTLGWTSLAVSAGTFVWMGIPCGRTMSWLNRPGVLRGSAVGLVAALVAIGLFTQIRLGVRNLNFELKESLYYPDIEAAQWIASHTDPTDVVLARKEDLVHHYSRHRVIWLPPSSDAKLLMNGVARFKIKWVVVVDRAESYFLPSDNDCFTPLARAFPDVFHLVHNGPGNRVYQVALEPHASQDR